MGDWGREPADVMRKYISSSLRWADSLVVHARSLTLQDLTKSSSVKSYLEPCPKKSVCKDATAEVVSEGYNKDWNGPADFGRESFSDISLGEYGDLIGNFATTSWTNLALFQKQKKVVDAAPTPLSDSGTAFSVIWHSDK